jgi:hypothetical protein
MTKSILHTDALEERYGPIRAIVMRHDPLTEKERVREAKLVDNNGILRTYALTFLTENNTDPELMEIDEKIHEGALMGRTFRDHGYEITRDVFAEFILPIPSWMQNEFRVTQKNACAKLMEFRVQKKPKISFLYGVLLEIYSPDFCDPINFEIKNNKNALEKANVAPFYKKITEHLADASV